MSDTLQQAREIVAQELEARGEHINAAHARRGNYDDGLAVRSVMRALS